MCKAATHVRSDRAIVQGKENQVSGIDPATIARFYHFDWQKGSSNATLTQLGADGALVTKGYADDEHVKIGDSLSVQTPSGAKGTL